MKVFMLIACVLAIAKFVYASDAQKVQQFYTDLAACAEDLNVPEKFTPPIIKCVMQKMDLIDEYGAIRQTENLISANVPLLFTRLNVRGVEGFINTCRRNADKIAESNDEKTLKTIECALPIMAFFEEPQ